MSEKNTVVDAQKQVMRCQICGDEEPLSIINGRKVGCAVRILNAFVDEHRECKSDGGVS